MNFVKLNYNLYLPFSLLLPFSWRERCRCQWYYSVLIPKRDITKSHFLNKMWQWMNFYCCLHQINSWNYLSQHFSVCQTLNKCQYKQEIPSFRSKYLLFKYSTNNNDAQRKRIGYCWFVPSSPNFIYVFLIFYCQTKFNFDPFNFHCHP